MSEKTIKKFNIGQVTVIQVVGPFIVVSLLIVLGGVLVFHVMGTEYTQYTVMGFIATAYMAFITFQPAGSLFTARKELIEGKVDLYGAVADASVGPPVNPWIRTLPLSALAAVVCTAIAAAVIYGFGWKPGPTVTVLVSLLYAIPHYLMTKRFMGRDLLSMPAKRKRSDTASSYSTYFWGTYVLPNIVFQSIINGALGNRAFPHEAVKLAAKAPSLQGLVQVEVVGVDLAITFMFVCNFTFLAATAYTYSGVFLGIIPIDNNIKGKGINGFLFFMVMLLMGLGFGLCYGAGLHLLRIENVSVLAAMVSKITCAIIAVYLGSRMALGWTVKKIKAQAHA